MNCKEICRNRFLAFVVLIMIIILNILSFTFQGLNWFTILLTCIIIFSILDIFEVPIFCWKKNKTKISLKDEAKQDMACRTKRLTMYEDLEKGNEEEKELLNEIKVLNERK